jgi:hypothetical protein
MTTNKITLELTLDELKLIDKHLWISVATKPILEKIKNAYPKPDVIEIGGVKYQRIDEPSKPMDEVVNRLVKKYEAQKLFNRLVDELGYDFDACNDIVDLVEDWILDEQSSAGSQNLDTELLVDGFNDAIRKMKEMLR